ncbi:MULTISPECIES: sulfatase-like hydrolase/transferase [unclassified Lentimonas]|uniref:sulfatase-like hydrolase/transferase n=1 Tax=unclassified Lentimonas TaxID=2630993 RepID=UPI001323B5B3|nr:MULTISPECIES: sulfatase-like hydrolase/transferase [unclassified Lentimonas]CAA6679897.1 Choline-sulfatase (EC [Lentimonas sp. CC4]CAA6683467.1 Choline-sulfatase (EC [Lentimonas sp. CC6]CAA7078056.1 Choline-sulfatase (EC [Lentimonas sp. CC4]CAA7171647.1 Choline-sulfatase (EC [Lentimonas sp. CC21]CAA7181433.1 Choline-sulfatase (EC [Lentimonas sp. CC8]
MKNNIYTLKTLACIGLIGCIAQSSALFGATRVTDDRLRQERSDTVVEEATKPNIIFILTDDQGYGDLQRHGHPYLQTPHINQLHDESVRLDNFYVSPSCSPTRAALLTGMHEFRNGVTHTLIPREHLFADAVTLPDLLKTAGYKTGFIGKWHLGGSKGYAPSYRGFDWTSTNPMGPRKHFDPEIIRNNVRTQRKGFREDIFFDEAMTFIEESGDQPFFCYLATYSPHTPLAAPESYITPFREQGLNDTHATYLAMIENLDDNVGRLMKFLKDTGRDENTVVLFMNDNGVTEGLDVYNAGMRGCKATAWEGGTRAMSFWRWPNHWKPQTVENLSGHIDVLPTLCEIAGVEIPEAVQSDLEGFSLVPVLEAGNAISWHDNRMLFHHVGRWPSGLAESHKYAMVSARKGNLLLVRSAPCGDPACEDFQSQCTTLRAVYNGLTTTTYAKGSAQTHWGATPMGHWALFDVKADPACENDLSYANPEIVASMAAAYDGWWDDTFPVMMERGGDLGDPDVSAKASRHARSWKGPTSDKAKAAAAAAAKQKPQATAQETAMFKRMDSNGDNKVTQAEYVGLFQGVFKNKDADKNGVISEAEFGHSAFDAADTDQDGSLTKAEYQALYSEQFKHRDANEDGVLTPNEM